MRLLLFLALTVLSCGYPAFLVSLALLDWIKPRCYLPRPSALPLKNLAGTIILTYEDWARHSKALYPIGFFFRETIPRLFGRGIKVR